MCKDFRSDSYPHGSHGRRKCGELSWWCLPGKDTFKDDSTVAFCGNLVHFTVT